MTNLKRNGLLLLFLIFFCAVPKKVLPQQMQIPARIQAATFSKIFKYDTQLRDINPLKILIVYDSRSRSAKDELMEAFKNASLEVESAVSAELTRKINTADVIYFMPGLETNSSACKTHKKLSIAGMAKSAESGDVSVALGLVNNKPRLFVNMSSLLNEEHDLSANVLKISQVLR